MSACLFSVAILAVWCAGCAKIGDPLPPEVLVPNAADDLTARQRAGQVVLTVTLPALNTNGSAVTKLRRVEVYRLAEEVPSNGKPRQIPAREFQMKAEPVLSIAESRIPGYRRRNQLVLEDRFEGEEQDLLYTRSFRYAVLFVNDKNQAAGFSNQVIVTPVPIPPAPGKITSRVFETSIDLKWTAPAENADGSKPARISGYNVYRSQDPDMLPESPVNAEPIAKPEFKDVHFEFDTTYYYRVSVVGGPPPDSPESLPSEAVEVVPRDVFPPLPPDNFSAVSENGIVHLFWNASPSADVAGYRISRREGEAGEMKTVYETSANELSYRDETAASDKKYRYSIIAMDTHGNKSPAAEAKTSER